MMRFARKAVALSVALALTSPQGVILPVLAAEASKPERASLDLVEVAPDQVRMRLSQPVRYNTFVTANPPRLVLEMLNTQLSATTRVQDGKGKFLKRVRSGQFAGEPNPIARIVMDLGQPVNYRVLLEGNELVVKLEGAEGGAEDAAKEEVPAAPKLAAAPEKPAVPEVKPVVPAPKPAATEAKPAAPAPKAAEAKPAAPAPQAAPEAPQPVARKPRPAPRPAVPEAAAPPLAKMKIPDVEAPAPARPAAPKADDFAADDAEARLGSMSSTPSEEVAQMGLENPRERETVEGSAGPSKRGGRRDIMASLPRDNIAIDLDNTDIRDAIKMMAAKANINIIYGPEVSGTVSLHLAKVPFYEAFNILLSLNKLVASQVGENILWITTPDSLKNQRSKAVGLTRIFPVNYGVAADLKTQIDAVRAAEGRIGSTVVDVKNNALIVTESPDGLASVERLLAELDVRPRQVLIETKLVEVKLTKDLQLGIQWDYLSAAPSSILGETGRHAIGTAANPLGVATPFTSGTGNSVGTAGRGTGVQLPADKVFGAFTFGRITNNTFLSATLTTAAAQGKVKVLSDPKIATLNGKEASINITTSIPYVTSTVASTGVTSQSVSYTVTGIQLQVKPTINADGRITLEVAPNVSQPSATAASSGVGGAVAVDSRNAKTMVLVKDGETIVIGGLITDSISNQEAKIPLLGDIPVLGWLFKKKTVIRSRVELLIFVTTKILPD